MGNVNAVEGYAFNIHRFSYNSMSPNDLQSRFERNAHQYIELIQNSTE